MPKDFSMRVCGMDFFQNRGHERRLRPFFEAARLLGNFLTFHLHEIPFFLSVCYACTNAIKYEKMRKYHFFICWQSPTNTNCTTLTVPEAKAEFMAIFLSEAEKEERKCSTGAFSCEAKKQPFLIFLTPSHITSLAFVQVWEHAGVYGIAGG